LSWSVSSAYQSAAFAMRATMGFLGVSVAEVSNVSYLLDLWAPPEGTTRKALAAGPGTIPVRRPRPDHKARGALFEGLWRRTVVDNRTWPCATVRALTRLEPSHFASQRNQLHYRTYWPMGDLYACRPAKTFLGVISSDYFERIEELNTEADDYSLALCLCVV